MLEEIALNNYFENLREYITEKPLDFGDGDSVLTLRYEAYADNNRMDDERIKEDFKKLYHLINGMTQTQMDTILNPVCALCIEHQRSGFVEGIKIGIRLRTELAEK